MDDVGAAADDDDDDDGPPARPFAEESKSAP
jgi:hypothetical protein